MLVFGAQVRSGEGRDTLLGFMTLFGVMSAHAILETARDALFLGGVSASRLPVVYIAVALIAFCVGWSQLRRKRSPSRRRLASWLVLTSGVTALFGVVADQTAPWTLYALYIWSAIAVSIIVTHFFLLLGERFTLTQAKRLYAVIGTGSVAGAIAGSAIASLSIESLSPRRLLFVAAGVLLTSAALPLLLRPIAPSKKSDSRRARGHQLQQLWSVLRHPYAGRVAALVVTATVTCTLADYVFKSTIVERIAADRLGPFLAQLYLSLNVLSMLVQVFVVRWVVRSMSVAVASAIMPMLLLFGGVGIALGGALVGAMALKSVDGALRHSLHRTLGELLYLPMRRRLRALSKVIIDLIGQRLGQALASIGILLAVWLGATTVHLAIGVVVAAAGWAVQAVNLREHYLRLFRLSLADAAELNTKDFPELDISSLESLMAALNSANETEVRAALSFLEEQGRTRAIPSLILYHPTPAVLVDALDILARSDRADFLPLTDRLLDHEYAAVRAAALRARIARVADERLLRGKVELSCPVVRATAMVGLAGGGYASEPESHAYFQEIIAEGSEIAKEALAKAISYRPLRHFETVLCQLAEESSTLVARAAIAAMASRPSTRYLPVLVPLLAKRHLRTSVQDCLAAQGEAAFEYLSAVLNDDSQPLSIRRYVPRTLIRFDPQAAAQVLMLGLKTESETVLRYKLLRALERLASETPLLRLDRRALLALATETIHGMFRSIDWRISLQRGLAEDASRGTEAHALLQRLLEDKERKATDSLFRVLGLLFPNQDVATVYRGLRSARIEQRSSSRELLESFVRPKALRTAVLALVDDAPDALRLSEAGHFYRVEHLAYDDLLVCLLGSAEESLSGLAVYQIGELGLVKLQPHVAALNIPQSGFLSQVITRTERALTPIPQGMTS